MFPDGVLIIDKPPGPTSHDVVAVVRRTLRLRPSGYGGQVPDASQLRRGGRSAMKVGHTGTLDPLASGVLPLVLGRATRLAQFLSSAEKEYEADVELGVSTTTFDRAGTVVETRNQRRVADLSRGDVDAALAEFRGSYFQIPPSFSAKKIDGDRAYDLARKNEPVTLEAAAVTTRQLDVIEWDGTRLRLRIVCSAGFYVRALAQALGERLGTGAHLAGLVRTRSGDFSLDAAVSLGELDQHPDRAAAKVILLSQLLPELPALTLTEKGASLAARGGFISASHLLGSQAVPAAIGKVRLLHPDGHLVAIAEPRPAVKTGDAAFLHPGVVLE
jgi:tRNA pseudouridine55 synthase